MAPEKTRPDTGDILRDQYEAYPYPERDPKEEAKRLITGSPSHVHELNHFVFAGRRDFSRPFRVLVAGGGTGDATVMLAQHLADQRCPAEITHIDLSDASRKVAEARIKARKLSGVSFRRMSLLELPGSGLGPFDYIDCCGVLHHLEDPDAGLAALASVLADDGGIGIMLYGELGRTGVYPAQDMLRMVTRGAAPAERVAVARRMMGLLPPTNWLKRNPMVGDHLKGGDPGLYDLLLHGRDRAYRVPEVAALADGAGLRITAFMQPALYEPASYIGDRQMLDRVGALSWIERCAFAELLSGIVLKHIFYVVKKSNPGPCVADPDDERAVPVYRNPEDAEIGRTSAAGGTLSARIYGAPFQFPVPPLSAAMLTRIDGVRSIADIRAELQGINPGLTDAAFAEQWRRLYAAWNGMARVLLRFPPDA